MNNPDHISESLETIFWGLKYLNSLMWICDPGFKKFGPGIRDGKNSDPVSGMEKFRMRDPGWKKVWIRDPGWKKIGSRMEKIWIRDKHPGSATLVLTLGGDSGVREAIQRSGRREEGIRVHQRHPALIQGSNSEQPELQTFLCLLRRCVPKIVEISCSPT